MVRSTDHEATHFELSALPCFLVPLMPKHSSLHPILMQIQPTFLPQC